MEEERLVTQITPKSEDFSRWYLDLIRRTETGRLCSNEGDDGHQALWLCHLGKHSKAAGRKDKSYRPCERLFPFYSRKFCVKR